MDEIISTSVEKNNKTKSATEYYLLNFSGTHIPDEYNLGVVGAFAYPVMDVFFMFNSDDVDVFAVGSGPPTNWKSLQIVN